MDDPIEDLGETRVRSPTMCRLTREQTSHSVRPGGGTPDHFAQWRRDGQDVAHEESQRLCDNRKLTHHTAQIPWQLPLAAEHYGGELLVPRRIEEPVGGEGVTMSDMAVPGPFAASSSRPATSEGTQAAILGFMTWTRRKIPISKSLQPTLL